MGAELEDHIIDKAKKKIFLSHQYVITMLPSKLKNTSGLWFANKK